MKWMIVLLVTCGCSTPTLQQRQDNWRIYQTGVKATCKVGVSSDPAMPDDVKDWCKKVVAP